MKTKLEDLTEFEFESLAYKAFEDVQCMSGFVYANSDDFDYWLNDKGIDSRFVDHTDYHLSYCEKYSDDFMEYAVDYFEWKSYG